MSKKITPFNAHGIKVVEFSDWLIKRGKTIRDNKPCCEHKSIVYDPNERRIQCENCETDLDPFDVVIGMVDRWDAFASKMRRDREALNEALSHNVRQRATKVLDDSWRKRDTVPACPHCSNGLHPDDFAQGIATLGKDYDLKRKQRMKNEPTK